MTVVRGTHYIDRAEPAYVLVEVNQMAPDYRGVRRYRLVYVNRDDSIAEWREDLGPAESFTAREFRVPSLWEHTVAELLDMSDQLRMGDDYWEKRTAELAAESTLITDWRDQVEERRQVIHNRTISGPGYTKQRNGAPSALAEGRKV